MHFYRTETRDLLKFLCIFEDWREFLTPAYCLQFRINKWTNQLVNTETAPLWYTCYVWAPTDGGRYEYSVVLWNIRALCSHDFKWLAAYWVQLLHPSDFLLTLPLCQPATFFLSWSMLTTLQSVCFISMPVSFSSRLPGLSFNMRKCIDSVHSYSRELQVPECSWILCWFKSKKH